MIPLAVAAIAFAFFPAWLYFRNVGLFRPPPEPAPSAAISVLIPARNEEASIAACVEAVLANRHVELECIVLDDHSDDRTAEIVRALAARDGRVRLVTAPPLPENWSGKQHACRVLSEQARYPILSFLDADVRLAPDALARLAAFRIASRSELVSGFPRQETGTFLERLVIPLIHFLLLGFLPLARMRRSLHVGFGAGCGQWFLTTRDAYERTGGHSHPRVRASFHDGLQLPRAYRACGLMTDVCDATEFATCRMYHSARQVWNGLAKNAREGLAAPRLIVFSTLALFGGQVLPFVLFGFGCVELASGWSTGEGTPTGVLPLAAGISGMILAYAPRIHGVIRYRQSWLGAAWHPFGVLVLIGIQWYATLRAAAGWPVGWKGRGSPLGAMSNHG